MGRRRQEAIAAAPRSRLRSMRRDAQNGNPSSGLGPDDIMQKPLVTPSQEYEALRDELNQSKRYVFERPLVIVGMGLAFVTSEGGDHVVALPGLLVSLLLFNFWFTVNRLQSAARIVAYIQTVLESPAEWRGWETSLREYRIWLKTEPNARQKIDEELKKNEAAVPDALMYYPPIFQLHIALVLLAMGVSVVLTLRQPSALSTAGLSVVVALSAVFARDCWKRRPTRMRSLIERNRIIWRFALEPRETEANQAVQLT